MYGFRNTVSETASSEPKGRNISSWTVSKAKALVHVVQTLDKGILDTHSSMAAVNVHPEFFDSLLRKAQVQTPLQGLRQIHYTTNLYKRSQASLMPNLALLLLLPKSTISVQGNQHVLGIPADPGAPTEHVEAENEQQKFAAPTCVPLAIQHLLATRNCSSPVNGAWVLLGCKI